MGIEIDTKESYVYKSIRKAALQYLFSLELFLYYACLTGFAWSLYTIFSTLDSDPNTVASFSGFLLITSLYLPLKTTDVIRVIITLIAPEKSTTAKQYGNIVSFEEMCDQVEMQRLHPIFQAEPWGISILTDFIVYKYYGQFFVIPYSAVREVLPFLPPQKRRYRPYTRRYFMAIQDTLLHWHEISCKNYAEKKEILYILNIALQRAHEESHRFDGRTGKQSL